MTQQPTPEPLDDPDQPVHMRLRTVVARNIHDHRALARISQRRLADRMRALGMSWHQQTVSHVESVKRDLEVVELVALAVALEVTLADLLDVTGIGGPKPGQGLGPFGLLIDPSDDGEGLALSHEAAQSVMHSRGRVRWRSDADGREVPDHLEREEPDQ